MRHFLMCSHTTTGVGDNTSTCFLSDKPEVIINTEQTSRLCSVKKIYSGELVVYGFFTSLAEGKNILHFPTGLQLLT